MKKEFLIKKLSDEATCNYLGKELSPYGGSPRPLQSLLKLLACRGAKTVVIEKGYVDKDYQDEFATFYSKAFKKYPQRCTRLHFFSVEIPDKTDPIDLANFQDKYLGFICVRPTDLQRIGRTLLSPFIENQDTEFVTCKTPFVAHILGAEFHVEAMPFIQQDTQVGACAQASLWMLARYMSRRFRSREYFPGEINRLATSARSLGRPLPAEWGLDLGQMLDALDAMGHSAVVYARQSIDACSSHIEVALPVDPKATRKEKQLKLHLQRTAKLALK